MVIYPLSDHSIASSSRFQPVRDFGQLFEYHLSDHHNPSSSSVFRKYVKFTCLNSPIWSSYRILSIRLQPVRELGQLFEHHSSDHPIPSSSSVFRKFVKFTCLNTAFLIILSHPLHSSSACSWTWSIIWIPFLWSSFSSSVFRKYVNLVNCLNTSHIIMLSHPLQPVVVRELGNFFEALLSDHPILFFPGGTWIWSIIWRRLILTSLPILVICL